MSYLLPHLQAMFDVPMSTLVLLSIICSAAMYFVRPHLVTPALVFIIGPICLVLSTMAYYGLTMIEYFPINKADQWLICTITAATIGNVCALGVTAAVSRAFDRSQAKQTRFHRA